MAKLCLGVGPLPIHPQHLQIMGDVKQWTLIDLYIKDPTILNWDASKLDEVRDGSVDHIYTSHLLEHFPQIDIKNIIGRWVGKLKMGGKLTINVPDMEWAARQILKHSDTVPLDGYYNAWEGEHGLMSIVYGSQSHTGEYHQSGFNERFLKELLEQSGLSDVTVIKLEDAHDMGVLLAEGTKA